MKRNLIFLTTLVALVQIVSAQERLAKDEALKYAAAIRAEAGRPSALPIRTDVDVLQPVGIRDEDYGALVLPQKNLDASKLTPALGAEIVPVGQLWLHKLTPMNGGRGIAGDKLRLVSVEADGETVTVPQCALGVKRQADGTFALVVFGKEKEPLLCAALKAIETKQEQPIEISAERQGDSGRITVKILGKFQSSFEVTELEM